MVINGMTYLPWFKWKRRKKSGVRLAITYPIELHRLKAQNYLDEQEFARVKQMLDSPDEENQVIAEQILLTLRKRRLKGLR
jgi:hypothetical protein